MHIKSLTSQHTDGGIRTENKRLSFQQPIGDISQIYLYCIFQPHFFSLHFSKAGAKICDKFIPLLIQYRAALGAFA